MGEAVNAIAKPLQTVTQGVMGAMNPLAGTVGKAMGATPLGGLMGDPAEEDFKNAKKNKNASTLLTGGLKQQY